jgi:hypothetical protein
MNVPCCGCDRDVELEARHVRTEDGRVAHVLCAEGKDWPGAEIQNGDVEPVGRRDSMFAEDEAA